MNKIMNKIVFLIQIPATVLFTFAFLFKMWQEGKMNKQDFFNVLPNRLLSEDFLMPEYFLVRICLGIISWGIIVLFFYLTW